MDDEDAAAVDDDAAPDRCEKPMQAGVFTSPPPPPEPGDDDFAYHSGLSPEQKEQRRLSRKPRVDHLADGVHRSNGLTVALFDVGDRIVVERRTDLLEGSPWLDTLVGKVMSIDDDTGTVSLADEDSDPRLPVRRYASYLSHLHLFKLAPVKGDPFKAPSRVRADAPPTASTAKSPCAASPGDKKGKGRPKGTKNRPKEVVQAEKEQRRKEREEKKRARQARRA